MAAVDYFLKIEGVDGESADKTHKGEIEIMSWSFGCSNAGSVAPGSGGGTGKVSFQDFHITKQLDKSSPILFLACASGQHYQKATLSARKAGGRQEDYFYIKMEDILISSYQIGETPTETGFSALDGGGAAPTEMLSLNFTKIEMSYKSADGTVVRGGWDLAQGKKV